MNKPLILIIDDEAQIRKLLEITLESNDYKVICAETAKEGIIKAANHPPDLILLDLGLPDKNGHEVLKELRLWFNNAIIILSVQNNESDIVSALDSGASDYLNKPFRTAELLARIRLAIKRNSKTENQFIFETAHLKVDLSARLAYVKDETLKLTSTEFNLLSILIKNEGKILTHQYLLKEIWGPSYLNETQYLRVFIAGLRKKIDLLDQTNSLIKTESGVGYRFVNLISL
jgi:two-component system KDP operon response regulator KdpE